MAVETRDGHRFGEDSAGPPITSNTADNRPVRGANA